jgi:hypothetical protein
VPVIYSVLACGPFVNTSMAICTKQRLYWKGIIGEDFLGMGQEKKKMYFDSTQQISQLMLLSSQAHKLSSTILRGGRFLKYQTCHKQGVLCKSFVK